MNTVKITAICAIILLILANTSLLRADDSAADENKTTFAFRFGNYTFFNKDYQHYYGNNAIDISLDLTFRTKNPYISCKFGIDGPGSTVDDYSNKTYFTSDMQVAGLSGAIIFHTPRKEKVRAFGGLGLGSYGASEDVMTNIGIPVTYEGDTIGYNFFGGVELALSGGFALSLECFVRKLNVDMNAPGFASKKVNYSGQSLLFGLNFSF